MVILCVWVWVWVWVRVPVLRFPKPSDSVGAHDFIEIVVVVLRQTGKPIERQYDGAICVNKLVRFGIDCWHLKNIWHWHVHPLKIALAQCRMNMACLITKGSKARDFQDLGVLTSVLLRSIACCVEICGGSFPPSPLQEFPGHQRRVFSELNGPFNNLCEQIVTFPFTTHGAMQMSSTKTSEGLRKKLNI